MRLRNLLLVGTAVALAATSTAMAAPVERYSFSNTQTPNGHTIHQGGNWEVVDAGGDGVTVNFRCSANAGDGEAIATGLLECYLLGADGSRFEAGHNGAVPGAHAVEGAVVIDAPRQSYRICVQANAFYASGASGAQTTLVCSP